VPAVDPTQLATALAGAITRLARDPALRARLAGGARERVAAIGLWENKIRWLLDLYAELILVSRNPKLREVV
jgi:hypothetical protein